MDPQITSSIHRYKFCHPSKIIIQLLSYVLYIHASMSAESTPNLKVLKVVNLVFKSNFLELDQLGPALFFPEFKGVSGKGV